MDDAKTLETLVLDHNEWRGLKQLSNAMSEFEPLAKRARLGPVIADRLVAMTLAEKGDVSERYVGIGYEVGYKLTELGWAVLYRGRRPHSRRT
ncbi:hypothetical protein [Brevundimonas diminuta]|uniref:hypothetical protein n=1 Tax=Brevundimonas diminuta TaxID=293 RepID=UPI001F55AF13|nr:hypothetical protein [Brevundimonas diminuta]